MSRIGVFVIIALCICTTLAGDNLDFLISEVFGNPSTEKPTQQKSMVETDDCTCVPYYLCINNSILTDGQGLLDIQVRDGPCQNYMDVCCQHSHRTQDRITPEPIVRQGCGKRNPEGVGYRITGDEDGEAQYGEFPWMVAILKEELVDNKNLNVFQCGGSLIHPEVVVTAAHCVKKSSKYKVRLGEWDTQTDDEIFPHQDVFVDSVAIHPRYHAGALYNDVALLFLSQPVTFADNIDVVCLPQHYDKFDYSRCFTTGWGKDFFSKEGKYQVILKKVDVPIVPSDTCESSLRITRLGPHFNLHNSFICAGGEAGKDACKGDGGSPLVCPIGSTGKYAQAGIVSWGVGCGEKGTPGIYTNVASVRGWIDEQLDLKHLDKSYYIE